MQHRAPDESAENSTFRKNDSLTLFQSSGVQRPVSRMVLCRRHFTLRPSKGRVMGAIVSEMIPLIQAGTIVLSIAAYQALSSLTRL